MEKKVIYRRPNGEYCCKRIVYTIGFKSTSRKRTFVKIDIVNNPVKGTIFTFEGVEYRVRKILTLTSSDVPIKRKRIFKTIERGYHMRIRVPIDGRYKKTFVNIEGYTNLSLGQNFEHNGVTYQVKTIVDY